MDEPQLQSLDQPPASLEDLARQRGQAGLDQFFESLIGIMPGSDSFSDIESSLSELRARGGDQALFADWLESSGLADISRTLDARSRAYYDSHPELHEQSFVDWARTDFKPCTDEIQAYYEAHNDELVQEVADGLETGIVDEDDIAQMTTLIADSASRVYALVIERVGADWPEDFRDLVQGQVAFVPQLIEQIFSLVSLAEESPSL